MTFADTSQKASTICLMKSTLETVVFELEISITFEEWLRHIDQSEAEARKSAGVQLLYRGLQSNSLNRVIIIHQAEKGVIDRYVSAQADVFVSNGSTMTTLVSKKYFY